MKMNYEKFQRLVADLLVHSKKKNSYSNIGIRWHGHENHFLATLQVLTYYKIKLLTLRQNLKLPYYGFYN